MTTSSISAAPAVPAVAPSMRWTLATLSLSMLLSSLGTSIAHVGLPTLATVFDATFQDVQWVVLAYLLAITTLIVGVGRLGDLLGRRRLMLAGLVLFTLASTVCGLASELWQLVAARAAQGLGAAVMMALTLAFVADTVPKDKAGTAMGLLGTMSAVGTAMGPSLGGLLIAGFGWRSIFLFQLPLGLLALLLVYRYLPAVGQAPKKAAARFDTKGMLLLALALAAYALAMTLGRGDFGLRNLALIVAAGVGIALFLRVEAAAASPLIQLSMFRNPVLGAGFATSALVATVVMATLVVGPFYLSLALLLDPARVGLVMASGPMAAAIAGMPSGRAVDRFGAPRMATAGLLAMLAGTSILPMLPMRLGVAGYLVPLVVITAGYALFQAANNTAVMAGGPAEQRGVLSGMLGLSRNLGLITGASVMGAVFAFGSATVNVVSARPEAVATGIRTTFAVAAAIIVVALGVAAAGRARSAGANV